MIDLEKSKEIIKEILLKKEKIEAILVFGSYVRGSQTPESDLDIAIKADAPISKKDLYSLQIELEEKLKIEIDLVDLMDLTDGFRYEILMNGELIYCRNNYQFDLYKLDMFREYLELNESRQIIIETIKKGGTIYGE